MFRGELEQEFAADGIKIVRSSLVAVNTALSEAIGDQAVALYGDEIGLQARQVEELGLVGDPQPSRPQAVVDALAAGKIPVVMPLAEGPLNVNADDAAAVREWIVEGGTAKKRASSAAKAPRAKKTARKPARKPTPKPRGRTAAASTPDEAKLSWPGRRRASATSSRASRTGSEGATTSTCGADAISITGARSVVASKPRCLFKLPLMVSGETLPISSV